eukprot:COSAG01_NODE_22496_length_853_cov_1.087533_1_plen_58_part_00
MADTYGTPLTDTSSGCESALKARVERAKLYYTSGTHTGTSLSEFGAGETPDEVPGAD